jgi:hypothetical protein
MNKDQPYQNKYDDKIIDKLFCPVCKKSLKRISLIDNYYYGVQCKENHIFNISRYYSTMDMTESLSQINKKNISNLDEIPLLFKDRSYRLCLNSQLAIIIRVIYELVILKRKINLKGNEYRYCPICSSDFKIFKQKDIWVTGKQCKNNHRYLERNGIRYLYNDWNITIMLDYSKEDIDDLIPRWFDSKNKLLENQMDDNVRFIFKEYLKLQTTK